MAWTTQPLARSRNSNSISFLQNKWCTLDAVFNPGGGVVALKIAEGNISADYPFTRHYHHNLPFMFFLFYFCFLCNPNPVYFEPFSWWWCRYWFNKKKINSALYLVAIGVFGFKWKHGDQNSPKVINALQLAELIHETSLPSYPWQLTVTYIIGEYNFSFYKWCVYIHSYIAKTFFGYAGESGPTARKWPNPNAQHAPRSTPDHFQGQMQHHVSWRETIDITLPRSAHD